MRMLLFCAALVSACGGAVCGDGKVEGDEQCDDGNTLDGDSCSASCRALATVDTYLHFAPFIAAQFPGFNETCIGLGIAEVEVSLAGPTTHSERVECSFGQTKLSSLPSGAYTASARAFDASGALISKGMAHTAFTVAGANQDVYIDWPWEDFTRSYTGTFFFQILWQAADTCAGATPPVVKHRLLLERGGTPVAGTTDQGDPLDASATGACRNGNEPRAQAAVGLGWGPARMTITGEDGSGREVFRGSFETFVGAGLSNPVLTFDVPSVLPDAGPSDAAVADGGL